MLFPEFLYRLSQRDQQVTWLDPLIRRVTTTAASINPIALVQVPEARALVLFNVALEATPGAGQNVASQSIISAPNSGNSQNVSLKESFTALAAGASGDLNWQGWVILPAGHEVRASPVFNAGVAANTVVLFVHGILIPIANIQRV